jgi:hypothetical protein
MVAAIEPGDFGKKVVSHAGLWFSLLNAGYFDY